MQREVTLLNKSNKFVTVKWLARIAFHVGQCSRTCSTVSWVWHTLHWGGLSLFSSSEGIRVSRRCFQFGVDKWLFHHDMIWLCSPLVQLHEACFQFQDSMMTATSWERDKNALYKYPDIYIYIQSMSLAWVTDYRQWFNGFVTRCLTQHNSSFHTPNTVSHFTEFTLNSKH